MTQTLAKLLRQTQISSHEEILEAADAALKQDRSNEEAQRTRAVALLNLDRFDDAVRAFDADWNTLKEQAVLEYAYALYKSGDLDRASKLASQHGATGSKNERGFKHLLAQSKYRMEEFETASKLYEELAQDSTDVDEQSDLRINSAAAFAQSLWKDPSFTSKRKSTREELETFEGCYNAACASIAKSELSQAEVLLRRAVDLCQASDLSEDAKSTELAMISVQRSYVLRTLGRREEAKDVLEGVNPSDIADQSTRRLANIAMLAVGEKPANPYITHRDFHSSERLPYHDSLFGFQSSLMRRNEYVIDLWANKNAGVARSATAGDQQQATISSSINSLSVLKAAAKTNGESGKSAIKTVLGLLQESPANVGLLLTAVQLHMARNDHGSAIALSEKFAQGLEGKDDKKALDVRFAPGFVGMLVALYKLQGRTSHIRQELTRAAEYWRTREGGDNKDRSKNSSLLKAGGVALLGSGSDEDVRLASMLFGKLHADDSSDKAGNAGLVAALALHSPDKISSAQLEALSQSSRLVAGLDPEALEQAGVARQQIQASITKPSSKKRAADENGDAQKQPKQKKIRPSRMPKNFDPDKQPDPERWLPLRDRSSYRPKNKKGKARMAGLTQGGVVDEKLSVDQSSRPGTSSGVVVVGSGGPGGGAKKKKGKPGKK